MYFWKRFELSRKFFCDKISWNLPLSGDITKYFPIDYFNFFNIFFIYLKNDMATLIKFFDSLSEWSRPKTVKSSKM